MSAAMWMTHGDYVLPDNVPANEFLNIEGNKLSASRGWAVWLHEYLEEFDPDQLRYALATTLPETKDADFSWADFQAHANSELADILGNFVNRTLTLRIGCLTARSEEHPAELQSRGPLLCRLSPEKKNTQQQRDRR